MSEEAGQLDKTAFVHQVYAPGPPVQALDSPWYKQKPKPIFRIGKLVTMILLPGLLPFRCLEGEWQQEGSPDPPAPAQGSCSAPETALPCDRTRQRALLGHYHLWLHCPRD